MGQMGFFDIANRYAGLDAKNDPLARIDEGEALRLRLETVWRRPPEERKSPAGRKPWDAVVMFKAIVLCEMGGQITVPMASTQRCFGGSCPRQTCDG